MDYNNLVVYAGLRFINNSFLHLYYTISDNYKVVNKLTFKTKIFSKGSIGAVYKCSVNNKTINYNSKTEPIYLLKDLDSDKYKATSFLFEDFSKWEVLNDIAKEHKRLSTKVDSKLKAEVNEIKSVYKSLSSRDRSVFIADLIYKITK